MQRLNALAQYFYADIQNHAGVGPLSCGDKRGNVLGLLRVREGEAHD